MPVRIFVSLAHVDGEIATALCEALEELFGEGVELKLSPSCERERGIPAGEHWFNWVIKQARSCDFAFVILTPASVGNAWITFEAGAVCGATAREGVAALPGLRPLLFGVEPDAIPEPILVSKAQAKRGDSAEDMEGLLAEITEMYSDQLGQKRVFTALRRLHAVVAHYLERLQASTGPDQHGNPPQAEPARADNPGIVGTLLNNLTAPGIAVALREMLRLERANSYNIEALTRLVSRLTLSSSGSTPGVNDGAGNSPSEVPQLGLSPRDEPSLDQD